MRNDGYHPKAHVPIQPTIGLEREVRQAGVCLLDQTLANPG
jgi:hypothetical protein